METDHKASLYWLDLDPGASECLMMGVKTGSGSGRTHKSCAEIGSEEQDLKGDAENLVMAESSVKLR